MAPSTASRWPAVTFRGRLVLATTAAVLVVVVLGSVATYLVAYNSLVGSVDVSLNAAAQQTIQAAIQDQRPIINQCSTTQGNCIQVVLANGMVNTPDDPQVLAIPDAVKASAASQGQAPTSYFSSTVNGVDAREVVATLPPGFVYRGYVGPVGLRHGGALQITTPLTGVNQELRHLALALWFIVLGGVAVAILLGLAVGRTALRPLNSLTETVEELAETTDVSRRLDPGGPDELGRLRRAFNRLLVALDTSRESQRQL
ncbi:MAG TPA: HAMP domain-containing protein, partial [Acidimicrobiales bacterium]